MDLLVVDGQKGRWDEALPPEEHAPGDRHGRRGALAGGSRRGCSRAGSTSSPRDGPYEYGDVVVLLRATTSMSVYERALVERDIPTYVVGGRGYWSQQQVSDLRATGWRRSPTRSTSWRSSPCSPPRWSGSRSTRSPLIGLHARRSRKDPMVGAAGGVTGEGDGLAELLPPAELGRARAFSSASTPSAPRRRASRSRR